MPNSKDFLSRLEGSKQNTAQNLSTWSMLFYKVFYL